MTDLQALNEWISKQEDRPILHINGVDHPTAIITVDFGQPLSGVSISSDRGTELTSLIKSATKELLKKRVPIRVNYDNNHGVFWSFTSQ